MKLYVVDLKGPLQATGASLKGHKGRPLEPLVSYQHNSEHRIFQLKITHKTKAVDGDFL